jgi:tRNA-uridine 2-sulfurtransferase
LEILRLSLVFGTVRAAMCGKPLPSPYPLPKGEGARGFVYTRGRGGIMPPVIYRVLRKGLMAKAVALLSGGLDSMLSIKLMLEQGVEVLALHFLSVFNCGAKPGKGLAAKKAADALGCPLKLVDFTEEQLGIVKDPPHGFGSAANPCIDCHMAMLRRAAKIMEEVGADFIVTGEVVGQRPMSQRRFALGIIDRATGLEGKILRPLSAKALSPTEAEEKGLVDRERLEGIVGRTRTRQMEMAKAFGITAYPTPAGGCLLTDPEFGARVKDLIGHEALNVNEAHLLKVGRHYRLDERTKVIVGRNERENLVIVTFSRPGDILLSLEEIPGPTALLRGNTTDEHVLTAAALMARSSKARLLPTARVCAKGARSMESDKTVEVTPATDEFALAFTITAEGKQHDD